MFNKSVKQLTFQSVLTNNKVIYNNRKSALCYKLSKSTFFLEFNYFTLNDWQSVHSVIVGLLSCVPT